MKTFSCLTVSKRTGWEDGAWKAMQAQTTLPKDWIVVHETPVRLPHYSWIKSIKAPDKTRASNLNASLNEGLRHIDTDYVIFYQDFIDLPRDCFEKLIDFSGESKFVTTATINADGSNDSRYIGADLPRPIRPEEWEANVAIAPMKIIRELGGFWEDLDNGWSWDNVHLAQRAAMLGCRFWVYESNRPRLLPHEQTSKLKLELNGQRCANNIAAIRAGKAPLKLNYL